MNPHDAIPETRAQPNKRLTRTRNIRDAYKRRYQPCQAANRHAEARTPVQSAQVPLGSAAFDLWNVTLRLAIAMGPAQIADVRLTTRVNGETRQSSSIDALSFSPAELIAEITDFITLEPGDVIATGTPAGVSPLADGDEVVVEIEGIGALETTVRR